MEEIKDLIGKEDYDKYKKLLQEFECKAIDTIENLTWQFKEELAEEIDDKIKGWKKESERLLKENWVKDDKIKKLEQELAELKEKAIVPRFKKGDTAYAIMDTDFYEDGIFKVNILDNVLCYRVDRGDNDISTQHYTRLFATEQEAQAKLKELQGNE